LYCHANPINNIDPSGEFTLIGLLVAVSIITIGFGILLWLRPKEKEPEELPDEELTVEVGETIKEGLKKLKEKSQTDKNLINELIPYINARKIGFTIARG